MARQKVDAPATRIQRNLLSPVDTFYQSKTGVVVQPGEKSDGLRALEKSLNVAKRENDVREEKWNKEQQTLGTKAAMAAMAKDPRLSKMGADVHPSQSYQFQMAYDAKAGEVNAINFTTALKEEFDALAPTFDDNGVPQPPDYLKFFQEKVGQKVGSLGDNQFFIGGFNKQLNQFLPQAYAEGAAKSRKIKTDAMVRTTGELIYQTSQNPSLSDTQKIKDIWLHTNKMLGIDNTTKKKTLLDGIIAARDPDLISEFIRLSNGKQLLIPNSGAAFGLTYDELANLKKTARSISDEGMADTERNRRLQNFAKADAEVELGNLIQAASRNDTPEMILAKFRGLDLEGSKGISNLEIIDRVRRFQKATLDAKNLDTRSNAQINRDHLKLPTEIQRQKDLGITNPVEAALRAMEVLGLPNDLAVATKSAASIYKGEKSWDTALSVAKNVPKSIGADSITGRGSQAHKMVRDKMSAFVLDLQRSNGKFNNKQFDVNSAQSIADAMYEIKKVALQQTIQNDPELARIARGPNARDASGIPIAENVLTFINGTPDPNSKWLQASLSGGASNKAVYEMLISTGAISEPTQPPQPPTVTPAATPAPTTTPDPDARPVVGDYSRMSPPEIAALEARDRRKVRAFDRTIRPEQITTEERQIKRGADFSGRRRGADTVNRAVATAASLDVDQLRAIAEEAMTPPEARTRSQYNPATKSMQEIRMEPGSRPVDDREALIELVKDFFDTDGALDGRKSSADLYESIADQVIEYVGQVEAGED